MTMNFSMPTPTPTTLDDLLVNGVFLPVAFVAALSIWLFLSRFTSSQNFPPGPKPSWLVGHTFQVPTEKSWLYFHSLAEKYGPMVGLSLAGTKVLVLDNPEDADELLTKRSSNYSSRKQLVYAGKYRSHDKRLVLLPYGPLLKKQRSAVIQMVNARVVGSYERIQEEGSMKLLSDLLDAPNTAYISVKRYTGSTLLNLVYGKNFKDDSDLRVLIKILESFALDMHPAAHLVDTFGALDWFPNVLAPWRKQAEAEHENEISFYKRLLYEVKHRMDAGENLECFAARLWENWDKNNLDETSVAYVAGSAFEAGTDNTAGSVLWFLVAVLHFPEVVRKAQAELDCVLGSDGLTAPALKHLEQLPYSVALTKEVFRWMPVAPCCAPHMSEKEDLYKGFFIPANTLVIPNIWAFHHNEALYPEPFRFNPDRFMPTDGATLTGESLNEGHWGFGFGRRVCPGQYLASKSVWIAIVRLLWAFDIAPPLDASGRPVLPDPGACRQGLTAEPEHFDVVLKARSSHHAHTIRQSWVD